MDEKLCRLALTQVSKVGVVLAKQLMAHCGSALSIFRSRKNQLMAIPGIGPQIAEHILSGKALLNAEREIKFIEKNNIRMLFFLDEAYPQRLKHQQDSPVMLFYKGNADLNALRVISIVGTRQPTSSGRINCERLIEEIRHPNLLIVSGLAYGIDSVAHKKSLDLQIPNIAVLGHGLQRIYPAAHLPLARQLQTCGGVLTEFWSDTGPEKEHFPMRNRIIAGLCDALVVVETAEKGGSMISAELANAYHKDVFAFPGRVNDSKSRGCNLLIKKHKAALIEGGTDLIEMMGWEKAGPRAVQTQLFSDLSDQEKLLINLFQQEKTLSVDYLSYQCHLPGSQLSAILLGLEFKGLLRSLPGNRFTLIR